MPDVLCTYCGKPAIMVKGSQIYGAFHEAAKKNYWVCWDCDAYVGTHRKNLKYDKTGVEPLGILANRELRRVRIQVHAMFDPLWTESNWTRREAYEWFKVRMGMSREECHIGSFDLDACEKAKGVLRGCRKMFKMK